jgi:uroporphyrinogen-III synthase
MEAYTVPIVAIGPTTARAAERLGYRQVYEPAAGSKGLWAWASAVIEAANKHHTPRTTG